MNGLENLDKGLTTLMAAPLALLLLFIAVLPLVPSTSRWWEKNTNKFLISSLCALSGILLYLLMAQDVSRVFYTYLEYAAFITMLASLYIVSGGIHISGAFAGFPYMNTLLLLLGAILANFLGTTGASMLLIRPLLKANERRKHKVHIIVFFIFIVSNCGGLLTPLGDPPLYLGFLKGVPFDWTLGLAKQWALVVGILLFIFHLLDERIFNREDLKDRRSLVTVVNQQKKKIHIQGMRNVVFLVGLVGVILGAGYWVNPALLAIFEDMHLGEEAAHAGAALFQIVLMGLLAFFSYRLTPARLHKENQFSFHPILEVAVVFFGIFGAMIPALALLEANAKSFALAEPWQYFWATGILSGFLDNAPTYLTFATLAASQQGIAPHDLGALAARSPAILAAISCGSVFMGSLTYIGNGPNFMVRAIAERSGVKMPSFGGYMIWSFGILIPVFVLVALFFF